MANHKSAEKRARQNKTKNLVNKMNTTRTRTVIKKLRTAISEGNKEEATSLLTKAQCFIGRMAKTGIIKKNTAARRTSRLAQAVGKIS